MKRITANIPEYIKSIVDKEEKILWASSPNLTIPQGMKYPEIKFRPASLHAFIRSILP